jgi:hypothetical protein
MLMIVRNLVWNPMKQRVSRRLTHVPSLLFPVLLAGCSRSATTPMRDLRAVSASQQQMNDEVRQQLDMIPPPSKTRFMAVKTLTSWENPYLTVQDNMLTLHVTLGDANTSALGQGGMLRPVGARRQDLTIRVGELPAALNAVPQSAWPYGRVVAIEEAHNVPARARPEVRRNMESVMKTLGDLGVVVYEWSEGGAGLR